MKRRFETLRWKKNYLELLDQTKLPAKVIYLRCRTEDDVWRAIRTMKVRGAPAIGVAAAYGAALGAERIKAPDRKRFLQRFSRLICKLASARPTARNLFSALEQVERAVRKSSAVYVEDLKKVVRCEAERFDRKDRCLCEAIGRFGEKLFKSGDTVLTHCNAGALATAGIGTALGVLYTAAKRGKKLKVFADETRPFLQGARLTAWELQANGLDVTLICDNMAGFVMRNGLIDKVIVGADRIARNGDTANKIGTYMVAELARKNRIPFYVAAPTTTFDFSLKDGRGIEIEIRSGGEVYSAFDGGIAPRGVKIYNPAFDVTPHELISGIITEKGVVFNPDERKLKRLGKFLRKGDE
ncbi:MAG TPA: S-methyl-5-thioribose-1-phosphate isomerase [Candidatus Omnitrophota bacterium]|nr:S-methyl-5-thioribose-1-phosphate isomerase [Candidatus Omnitrophota bacterium]